MHNILVVDDEPASLRTVERTLADEHVVLTATSATQGLALLSRQATALIIADQRMPEMSGTQLFARCAVDHPDTIRILLTGYTDVDVVIDAINTGHIFHYLTKPWEPHELRLVVRLGLERYAAEQERRRLQRELQHAYKRVRQEAEQKGRLLTSASHELGTPLHVLSSALAFMADMPLPTPARPWLDTAVRNAEWLGRGLAQMVRCARWHSAAVKLRRSRVDVGALLCGLSASFGPAMTARRLTLALDVEETLPTLHADRAYLEIALANLLSNAVRFTPDGGTITITATADDRALQVTIADTGIGIEAELLEDIFEPFSSAGGDLSLHTSGEFAFGSRGLGLGLAITKAVIEQHGGTIQMRSQRGAGTQITVLLPFTSSVVSPD